MESNPLPGFFFFGLDEDVKEKENEKESKWLDKKRRRWELTWKKNALNPHITT